MGNHDKVDEWRAKNPSCTYCYYRSNGIDKCDAKDIYLTYSGSKRKRIAKKCELFRLEKYC